MDSGSDAHLLSAADMLSATLAAAIVALLSLLLLYRNAVAIVSRQQRGAHLQLHLPDPVSQRPDFGHVHNWHEG